MKVVIEIMFILLFLYIAYKLYVMLKNKFPKHLRLIQRDLPKIPYWKGVVLCLLLFIITVFAQLTFFYLSLVIWFLMLFIFPFIFSNIKETKANSYAISVTFLITIIYAIGLFFNIDNTRDIIGYSFIENYSVFYTDELVSSNHGELGYVDEIRSVANVRTGDSFTDFILESIFPHLNRMFVIFIFSTSVLLNIGLREKYYLNNQSVP